MAGFGAGESSDEQQQAAQGDLTAALGEYQKRNALKVDCWPTAALLAHMEAAARN